MADICLKQIAFSGSHGVYRSAFGESGGSVVALAPCGFVSDLAHPSTSLLWATLVIVAYRATTIKPKVHNKPKLDDYGKVDKQD